jgi:hypothetical protein
MTPGGKSATAYWKAYTLINGNPGEIARQSAIRVKRQVSGVVVVVVGDALD